MLRVMLLSLLVFGGNSVGSLAAEFTSFSDRWRNRALHAAAGIVFAVVAVEIMPQALEILAGWQIAASFLIGGSVYLGVQALIERRSAGRSRMWMIYLAVATDLFGDGLLIGSGSAVSASLGLVLAFGQVLADAPEGAAAAATFAANDVPRKRRLLLTASFVLPATIGAAFSYVALRNQPEATQFAVLVATAGLFSVAAFEDMITEAHDAADDSRISTGALLIGFATFTLVSAGLTGK